MPRRRHPLKRVKGSPHKLTPVQMEELQREHIRGATARQLSRKYRLDHRWIGQTITPKTKQVRDVAQKVFAAELELKSMPKSLQIEVDNLLEEYRAVSFFLASAAKFGSMTAQALNEHAYKEAQKELTKGRISRRRLGDLSEITDVANKAAAMGLNLIQATNRNPNQPNDHRDLKREVPREELIQHLKARGLPTNIFE